MQECTHTKTMKQKMNKKLEKLNPDAPILPLKQKYTKKLIPSNVSHHARIRSYPCIRAMVFAKEPRLLDHHARTAFLDQDEGNDFKE